jgi:hypothetical protein
LNKLSDAEIKAHKKAMDVNYNKNFVGKDNPNFKYDTRKDFKTKKLSGSADLEDSWD